MNGNLSQAQQMGKATSINKIGAMPIKPKFDGPAPLKPAPQQGILQPGKNILIPNPGFF